MIWFILSWKRACCFRAGFGVLLLPARSSTPWKLWGRQKPKANEVSARVVAANRTHLLRAEAVVGAFQTVLHEGITPPDRALRLRLQSLGAVPDEALIQSAWRDLLALRQQWLDLPQAQTIRLDWHMAKSK
jgi:hypothetical protein